MDETYFHERADAFLENLLEAIEIADKDHQVSADFNNGILSIECETGGEYVLNKHATTAQIWLSSPLSGASRFDYNNDNGEWHKGDQITLKDVMSQELAKLVNINVEL